MILQDFVFTLLLLAGFLGGESWAQSPEITTRVASTEGKSRLLLPCVLYSSWDQQRSPVACSPLGRMPLLQRTAMLGHCVC